MYLYRANIRSVGRWSSVVNEHSSSVESQLIIPLFGVPSYWNQSIYSRFNQPFGIILLSYSNYEFYFLDFSDCL